MFFLIVLFVFLLIFLVLQPHKPRFYMQDATVRQMSVSDESVTSTLQCTFVSHNPNHRIGVLYDKMSAYASYLGQQITADYPLSPFYQDNGDTNVLSPILYGNSVPLAPFVSHQLNYERHNGLLSLNLRIDGRIRWKVSAWTSGNYYLSVNCFVILQGSSNNGTGGQVPVQSGTRCHVQV